MSKAAQMVELAGGLDEHGFRHLVSQRRDPDWVARRRAEAFERFQTMPMPSRDQEEWRRTDIRPFRFSAFPPPLATAGSGAHAAFQGHLQSTDGWAGALLQTDGRKVAGRLAQAMMQRGVVFCSMDEAVRSHRELVEPRFLTRCLQPFQDKFLAAHAAFWAGGLFLYVPGGVHLGSPLVNLTALSEHGRCDASHTLIVLDEGAEATVLQEQGAAPAADQSLHLGATELFVGPGATLRYVQLQDWEQRVWHFAHQRALLARGARLQWTTVALGSRLAKVNQEVVLDGPGSEATVDAVLFASGRQHFSFHTRQLHQAPRSRSDLLYKGALKDHARIVWRGMIRVEPHAQKTDAYQRNDNLVLSSQARADSIPGLEIEADDVRCTHGATAGRVDEDQVFYCMSRGLSRTEAMHLIVEGFFEAVLDRMAAPGVREALQAAVARKLGS